MPVSIVVTGGAGAIGGALGYAAKRGKRVAGLEIALRDPDDLAGNARRVQAAVDAARAEGVLDDESPVYVELPQVEADHGWLAAADVVAEAELPAQVPHRRARGRPVPRTGARAGAAGSTRRSTARRRSSAPPGCTTPSATPDHATGFEHHGFLNVLVATRQAFDGATPAEVATLLADTTPTTWSPLARDGAAVGRPGRRPPLVHLVRVLLVTSRSTTCSPSVSLGGDRA